MTGYPLKTPGQLYAENPIALALTDIILAWKGGSLGGAQLSDLVAFLADNLPISDAVQAALDEITDGAPATLDTLAEISAALGDDEDFAATVTAAIAVKASLASPAFTGSPTAPTAAPGTDTTQLATTAFVSEMSNGSFEATKGGTNQTGIAGTTITKVTFPSETFDMGGYFDPATSRWTPPAGRYQVNAQAYWDAGITDGQAYLLYLYKNGVIFKRSGGRAAGSANFSMNMVCCVEANGTDYFEVYVIGNGTGAKTLSGATADTFFGAARIG